MEEEPPAAALTTAMLTLSNSTVSGNSATLGGGISNGGTLTIANCTVSGNSGSGGGPAVAGGIMNFATLILTDSTVSGNIGGTSGGIYNQGILTLTNSTVSGNNATGNGGGIQSVSGTAHLFNATITNNQANGFGGGVSGSTIFNLQNTILAGNFPSDCGIINLTGNNLIGSLVNCTVQGNGSGITLADPKLGPLQDNGGPTQTQTHALLSGNPAIDGGNPGGCQDQFGALITSDQRGFPRPVDGNNDHIVRCDIGAVEFGGEPGLDSDLHSTLDVDFDGDGRNDIAVYRDGVWWILRSSNGGGIGVTWGGVTQARSDGH